MKSSSRIPTFCCAALALLAAASAAAQPAQSARRAGNADAPAARSSAVPRRSAAAPRPVAARGPLSSDELNTIAVFENVSRSVVFITRVQYVRYLFSRNVARVPEGSGSGFVWDEQGHIVTNFHVIDGAREFVVTLADQRRFPARVIGASPEHDLAVLEIDMPDEPAPPVAVGSSGDLRVGQSVLAIGNPFGFDHTLTTGVISALDREIDGEQGLIIKNLIQTDGAINPGNSGGPLIDSAGRLIGINTMIFSPSGAYAGIGFAVPVDTVNRVVPQLIAEGRYVRPSLGIEANDEYSRRLLYDSGVVGVVVWTVAANSPAARAGLRGVELTRSGAIVLGDVITAIDGRRVDDYADVMAALDGHAFGDRMTVTVLRGDGEIDVTVALDPEAGR
jgi:S1-C subfamily serine protease